MAAGPSAGGGGRGGGGATDPVEIAGAQLVFVGNGYVVNKTNTNPYKGLDVKGKIMVVAGLPAELAAAPGGGAGAAGAAAPRRIPSASRTPTS